MTGVDEKGVEFNIQDPQKDVITPLAKNVTKENGYNVKAVTLETFGEAIAEHEGFNKCASEYVAKLYDIGARETLKVYLQESAKM